MSLSKHWCFTLNNYTDDDERRLGSPPDDVGYIVYGKEVGESGTPHFQGFISFKSRKRFNQVIAVLGSSCHVERARNVKASIDYCKKDGDFVELGDPPVSPGERTDLESFKTAVKAGERCLKRLREDFSDVIAKYPRFVKDYLDDQVEAAPLPDHPLYDWQANLVLTLESDADDRTIHFLVDFVGNQGKTWFAKWWCSNHRNAQLIEPGKKADMAYALQSDVKYVFVNCTREQVDFLNYSFLEAIKDGVVFSPKYESRTRLLGPVHVVVMMNQSPDMNKLSLDRYDIINLD